MANQTITQLPSAGALTGTESVPIVQNGQTVQTTVGAIAASPSTNFSFITATSEPSLADSRQLATSGNGLSLTDGGAGGNATLALSGAAASLVAAGTGIQVKTSGTTLTGRAITAGSAGLSVADGDGVASNPAISLTGMPLYLAQSSGVGLLTRTSGNSVGIVTLQGTANQVDVANNTGDTGNPTISMASNPTIPGTGYMLIPKGTTAERPGSPQDGMIRFNTDTSVFEVYESGGWSNLAAGAITQIDTGTGLTGGPITSTGTISVATNGITDSLLRQSSGLSVIGRSANSTGDVADIAAASDHQVLRRSGSTLDFGAVNLAQANAVTGTLPVASGGTGQATYSDGELLIGNSTGNTLTKATLTAGSNVTITNAAGAITIAASNSGGTVTSVGLSLPAEFTVTNSPVTGSGTLTGAWANATQAYFFAGPASSTGTPTFRAIAVSDVPTLNQNTSGNAATATTATNVAGGAANQLVFNTGAGATSFAVAPTVANTFLEWSGSAFQWSANPLGTVTSVDVSGGTTGLTTSGGPITSSGTITLAGTLGIGNGGTGVTASPTNGQLLIGNGTGFTLATITAGSNITITNASGAITIASTGGGGGGGAGSNIFLSNNFGGM